MDILTPDKQHTADDGVDTDNRRGVAIILIVGLLAVLMISASAFSISMRIERRGSANYRNSIQARHLAWGALQEALGKIEEQMDPDGTAANFRIYPYLSTTSSKEVFVSIPPPGSVLTGQYARVMCPEAQEYIPGVMWPELIKQMSQYPPQWVYVTDTHKQAVDDSYRGRYAYIVVNASGLLDANVVGGQGRAAGVSPEEIMPVASGSQAAMTNAILQRNTVDGRYETLPELRAVNSILYSNLYNSSGSRSIACVDSLSFEGETLLANLTTNAKINLQGPISELSKPNRQAEIRQGLIDVAAPGVSEEFMWMQMLDYLDEDCVPREIEGFPCTEAVPMVNEIVLTNYFTKSGPVATTPVQYRPVLFVEFWYPFINRQSSTFSYSGTLNLTVNVDDDLPIPQSHTFGPSSTKYAPGTSERMFVCLNPFPEIPLSGATNVTISGINVRIEVVDDTTGSPVDAAPGPSDTPIALTNLYVNADLLPIQALPSHFGTGAECIDPRFNWKSSPPTAYQWMPTMVPPGYQYGTLGQTNSWTRFWREVASASIAKWQDDGYDMYVSDAGYFKNVGELGNLLLQEKIDRASLWRTVRLYDHPDAGANSILEGRASPVLDVFTLRNPTNNYRRGMININTKHPDVLAAAFNNAPIGDPDNPISRLDAGDAGYRTMIENITSDIVSKTWNSPPNSFFWDIADVAEADWVGNLPGMSDVEREMILGSSAGMLTARQNLFVIIVAGESYTMGSMATKLETTTGKKLSSYRAIAVVWRDPYPCTTAAGRYHRKTVLFYHPLEYD